MAAGPAVHGIRAHVEATRTAQLSPPPGQVQAPLCSLPPSAGVAALPAVGRIAARSTHFPLQSIIGSAQAPPAPLLDAALLELGAPPLPSPPAPPSPKFLLAGEHAIPSADVSDTVKNHPRGRAHDEPLCLRAGRSYRPEFLGASSEEINQRRGRARARRALPWPDERSPRSRHTLAFLRAAAAALAGVAVRTPLLPSPELGDLAGAPVWVKPEMLQRGAPSSSGARTTFLSRLDPDARARGVIAPSSGNHAQAVALAARLFGVPATVVMPTTVTPEKRRGASLLGGPDRARRDDHAPPDGARPGDRRRGGQRARAALRSH